MPHPAPERVLPGSLRYIGLEFTHARSLLFDPSDATVSWLVTAYLFDDVGEQVERIGDVRIVSVDLDGVDDPIGLLDGDTVDLGRVAAVLFDPRTGQLSDAVLDEVEGFGGRVLILDSVRLEPKWRGFGLGALVAGEAIRGLSDGAALVAGVPSPLPEGGEDALSDAAHQAAVTKLEDTWAQLGFFAVRDGVWILDLALTTLGDRMEELRDALLAASDDGE